MAYKQYPQVYITINEQTILMKNSYGWYTAEYIKIMNMIGVQEYYLPYDSIDYIHAMNLECRVDRANHYAMKYNKIQYELYK